MSESEIRYRHNSDILTRRLEGGLALIHVPSNKYYELNATASRLWELTGAGYTLSEIFDRLMNEYEVEEEALRREVEEMIRQLIEHDLLIVGTK